MRMIFLLPLLMVPACDVDNDAQNDQVTLEYNEAQIENTAQDVGNAAEEVGGAIAEGAEDAAQTIQNTDVDIDVNDENAEVPADQQAPAEQQ